VSREGLTFCFWQRNASPHLLDMMESLAASGCHVILAVEALLSENRKSLGWRLDFSELVEVNLVQSESDIVTLVESVSPETVHICSGVRGNGLVSVAQAHLSGNKLKQYLLMETIDDSGWKGCFRRLIYRRRLSLIRPGLEGVLTIGYQTRNWVEQRGIDDALLFPFAYFLPSPRIKESERTGTEIVRLIFVGQFIDLKRLDWLIHALAKQQSTQFELTVVGAGPLESSLRALALELLGEKVDWVGRLPIEKVPQKIASADCLILPSRYDGWGAVISEALMVGTPAVCSAACGAAGVVQASGVGGVFETDSFSSLEKLIEEVLAKSPVNENVRRAVRKWATCLSGRAGAHYLIDIIDHRRNQAPRPLPPWEANARDPSIV
jgi:glycosyltransferase involved in cell wall biosynthesis